MKNPAPREGYLALHGAALIDNGYSIVPIQVGKKAPGFDGWQKSRSTKQQLKDWVEHGHRWSGVGIITKETPAIDIDVRDEAIALQLEAWVRENIGDAPMRIGMPPKRLFVFRTEEPFRKMRTAKYEDEWKDQHQIEILGDGQQFVAYHQHPDTHKPYTWPNEGQNPLNIPSSDLPVLTVRQAEELITYFETIAAQMVSKGDWTLVKKARLTATGGIAASTPWAEDATPVDASPDEIRRQLMLVPNADDYDTWVQVGMALFHQFDGDDEGFDLWNEWSETADNYDHDALERHWKSFDVDGKRKAPITARYILKLAKEAMTDAKVALVESLREAFITAKDPKSWEEAAEALREAEINSLDRASIIAVAKDRRDSIFGFKTPLPELKKSLAYAPKRIERMPTWCEGWVYVVADDRFFHLDNKTSCTKQGFDAMYDRKALTKKEILEGKTTPTNSASDLALRMYGVKTVKDRRYLPGGDQLFEDSEGTFANTYAEHGIPSVPEKLLPRDKLAVERVKKHIAHLLQDEREQRMLIDWMSWVVQNPGKHANYAIVLQGTQGDGKTFFAEMMRAVIGPTNVKMLNAHILESDFTDWAEGQCLAAVEEVRLINDKNKYAIINRIKPFITNNIIEIHPKGKPVRNVKNTTNYMLFTNYRDALPLNDNDRRYLVLFSRWQRKEDLEAFVADNPEYYERLYATLEEAPGALRHWLLNHEQSDDFRPLGTAPVTASLKFMIQRAKPELIQVIDEIIEENQLVGITEELLCLTDLADSAMAFNFTLPPPKTLASMLERDGYEFLGRLRTGGDPKRYWSKNPDLFRRHQLDGSYFVDVELIRKFLQQRKELLNSEEL